MRSAAPLTFGARLALHRLAPEEARWFFNVPDEAPADVAPPAAPTEQDDRVQIGPFDV